MQVHYIPWCGVELWEVEFAPGSLKDWRVCNSSSNSGGGGGAGAGASAGGGGCDNILMCDIVKYSGAGASISGCEFKLMANLLALSRRLRLDPLPTRLTVCRSIRLRMAELFLYVLFFCRHPLFFTVDCGRG